MAEPQGTLDAGPQVQQARDAAVAGERARALAIDGPEQSPLVVDPRSNDPERRFGVKNADVAFAADLRLTIDPICSLSSTFRDAKAELLRKGVMSEVLYDPQLRASSGGGTTVPPRKSYRYELIFNTAVIPAGFHVVDVYVHEWGHVYEDHGGPPYQEFVNTVQRELGIRETRDSHRLPGISPRSR